MGKIKGKERRSKTKERLNKDTPHLYLTERDADILSFINQFGFCEIVQIQKQFQLKKQRSYKLVKKLVTKGLVRHQRIFYCAHGVYYLTPDGATHTHLPALKKLSTVHYQHHLTVIEVAMRLKAQHPNATWVSERELYVDNLKKGKRKRHLADGILCLDPDKKIAIEVELSRKGQMRLEGILKGYAKEDVDEVWYYCRPELVKRLQLMTQRMPFIKVINIEEFLGRRRSLNE